MDNQIHFLRFLDLPTFGLEGGHRTKDHCLEMVLVVLGQCPDLATDSSMLASLSCRHTTSPNPILNSISGAVRTMLAHVDGPVFDDPELIDRRAIENALVERIAVSSLTEDSRLMARVYHVVFSSQDEALDEWVDLNSGQSSPLMKIDDTLEGCRVVQGILSRRTCCVELRRLLVCTMQPVRGILLKNKPDSCALDDVSSACYLLVLCNAQYGLDQACDALRLLRTSRRAWALANPDGSLSAVTTLGAILLQPLLREDLILAGVLESEIALTLLSWVLCTDEASGQIHIHELGQTAELLLGGCAYSATVFQGLLRWVSQLVKQSTQMLLAPCARVMSFIKHFSLGLDEDSQAQYAELLARAIVEDANLISKILRQNDIFSSVLLFCAGALESFLVDACIPLAPGLFAILLNSLGHQSCADRYWRRFLSQLKAFAEGYPSGHNVSPQALVRHADNLRVYFGDQGTQVLITQLQADNLDCLAMCYDHRQESPNRHLVTGVMEVMLGWLEPHQQAIIWCEAAQRAMLHTQISRLDIYLSRIDKLKDHLAQKDLQDVRLRLNNAYRRADPDGKRPFMLTPRLQNLLLDKI